MGRPVDWWVLDLGGDPAPGDVVGVQWLAGVWQRLADEAEVAAGRVRALAGDPVVLRWLGEAGVAFAAVVARVPAQVDAYAGSYTRAAEVLRGWAVELEACQGQADRALVQGRMARSRRDAAQGRLEFARAALAAARADVTAAQSGAGVVGPDPVHVQQAVRAARAAQDRVGQAQGAVEDAHREWQTARAWAVDAREAVAARARVVAAWIREAADEGVGVIEEWARGDASGAPLTGAPATSVEGLGSPVPGTDAPWPLPQPWQPSDEGAGPWGSEEAGPGDYGTHMAALAAAGAAGFTWPRASQNLRHFLNNSGRPRTQDVDRLLDDVPAFENETAEQAYEFGELAADRARTDRARTAVTYPLASNWRGFYITDDLSQDWYYALGGVHHSVVGQVTVYPPRDPGGPWRYEVTGQVELRDRYNWDGGKSTEIGPWTITDEQLAELHRAGLAQEFTATGSSSPRAWEGQVR